MYIYEAVNLFNLNQGNVCAVTASPQSVLSALMFDVKLKCLGLCVQIGAGEKLSTVRLVCRRLCDVRSRTFDLHIHWTDARAEEV